MTKPPMNILRTDIEDVAEALKLKLMTRNESAQIGVDDAGDVSIAWAGQADVPDSWLVGTYTRKARVDDIEFDLVERLRELQVQRAQTRPIEKPAPVPRVRRTAAQQPSAVRRNSESALGCIPAPATRLRTAPAPAPRREPETVAEFRARGGTVEQLQGFDAVKPHVVRPAWRNAA